MSWNTPGVAAVVGPADGLAVEHELRGRERPDERHDARQPARHVVEVAGEEVHLVAVAVGLDAGAVELPLHRRAAELGGPRELERLGDRAGGGRQHRLDRRADRESDGIERGGATTVERDGGRRRQVAREHRGPSHHGDRDARGAGHGVGHERFQRALAELAEEEPPQQVGLGGRRPSEQLVEDRGAGGHRTGPGRRRELIEGRVDISDLERRLLGRAGVGQTAHRRPPDADASLAGAAREDRHHNGHLVGFQLPEQLGEGGHLGEPRPGGGRRVRRRRHRCEPRHWWLTGRRSRRPAPPTASRGRPRCRGRGRRA